MKIRVTYPSNNLLFRVLFFCFTVFPIPALAQIPADQEIQRSQLMELNQKVQDEGKRNNHHLVEQYMDSMIELMEKMEFPSEAVAERAHLRIQYSYSVDRLLPARDAAVAWLEKHPKDYGTLGALGEITLKMGRNDEARKAFRTVYESDPKNLKFLYRYLQVLNLLDDRDEAFRIIEPVLKLEKVNPALLQEIIDSYLRFNQSKDALPVIERMEKALPGHPYVHYARGKALLEQGEFEQSIGSLSKVPETSTLWGDAQQAAGLCLTKLRQFEKASHVFVDVLSRFPYDTKTMSLLEQALARQRKIQGFKQVQKIRQNIEKITLPDIEATYLWRKGDAVEHARLRSLALNRIGHFRESEILLQKACETVPDSTPALHNLANFYITTHQACRAEEIFVQLSKTVPSAEKKSIDLSLLQARLRQGKLPPADPLTFIQKIYPDSIPSMIGSYYLEIIGDASQAVSYLEKDQKPTLDSLAYLGRAYLELGEPGKARDCFDRLPKDYDGVKTKLAQLECLALLGKKDEANALWNQIQETHSELPGMLTVSARAALAEMNQDKNKDELAQLGRKVKQAVKTIQKKVMEAHRKGWPDSIPVLLELTDIYKDIGEPGIALQYAQLAYEGDPARIENRIKMIGIMTQPEQVFQRLSQIRIVKSSTDNKKQFTKETEEAFAHIQLTVQ